MSSPGGVSEVHDHTPRAGRTGVGDERAQLAEVFAQLVAGHEIDMMGQRPRNAAQKAASVADLLKLGRSTRPTTLWLAGSLINLGTTGPIAENVPVSIPQMLGATGVTV